MQSTTKGRGAHVDGHRPAQVLLVRRAADGAASDVGDHRGGRAHGAPAPGGPDQARHARGRHCLPRQRPLQGARLSDAIVRGDRPSCLTALTLHTAHSLRQGRFHHISRQIDIQSNTCPCKLGSSCCAARAGVVCAAVQGVPAQHATAGQRARNHGRRWGRRQHAYRRPACMHKLESDHGARECLSEIIIWAPHLPSCRPGVWCLHRREHLRGEGSIMQSLWLAWWPPIPACRVLLARLKRRCAALQACHRRWQPSW